LTSGDPNNTGKPIRIYMQILGGKQYYVEIINGYTMCVYDEVTDYKNSGKYYYFFFCQKMTPQLDIVLSKDFHVIFLLIIVLVKD